MDLAESTGKRIYIANLAAHPTGRINRRTSGFGKVHRIARLPHSVASPNHTPTQYHKEATINHDERKQR
jgi:hypothetical protein